MTKAITEDEAHKLVTAYKARAKLEDAIRQMGRQSSRVHTVIVGAARIEVPTSILLDLAKSEVIALEKEFKLTLYEAPEPTPRHTMVTEHRPKKGGFSCE